MRLNIPYIDQRELDEIAKVLASGYLTQGPVVARFEKQVADLVGVPYAFATSSCTTALHLALAALNIGEGDEVLVADFTFPATANVVVQLGAVPVLVDIDLDTFTINVDDLRAKITKKSRAIIPVHAFGCSADMDPIMEISRQYNIPVIEDAACAIGTTYKGRAVGSFGALNCFSFHPRKVITTGEGGMILTADPDLAKRVQLLRNHGGVRTGFWYEYEEAGYNYRLSDVLGAIGVAQMEKLQALIEAKRCLAGQLKEHLCEIPGITLPNDPSWGGHIYQSFVILVDDNLDRDRLVRDMRDLNIETTLGTYALHAQPFYQRNYGYTNNQLPNSFRAFTKTVTLPLYPQMCENDLQLIAEGLRKALKKQNCHQ